mmetsp:Transcript_61841/g.121697  ORF Transcript_61841/g.121697 Transcript_61841/m.121697 type:complete len:299 (-) Transcript_61841:632-1528(-)
MPLPPPVLGVVNCLMARDFCCSKFLMGILNCFASAMYSFQTSWAMNSFTSAVHFAHASWKVASYAVLEGLSNFSNSSFQAASSSLRAALARFSPSAPSAALRFSWTKMAKVDLGGCAGAALKNFTVITFMAALASSRLAAASFLENSLYCWLSFQALTSSSNFSRSCFCSSSKAFFSSSVAFANFSFNADVPRPSPLPASTSFLCFSAKSAKTDLGFFGASRRWTRLFSVIFTLKRSFRKAEYLLSFRNAAQSFMYWALSASASLLYLAFFSSGVAAHISATFLAKSPAVRPLFSAMI